MFVNLVLKYGLVPKDVYQESYHSSNSRDVNNILKKKFREYAFNIRQSSNPNELKEQYLCETYCLLCKFFGCPPNNFGSVTEPTSQYISFQFTISPGSG